MTPIYTVKIFYYEFHEDTLEHVKAIQYNSGVYFIEFTDGSASFINGKDVMKIYIEKGQQQ